jgi:hypothetical protein
VIPNCTATHTTTAGALILTHFDSANSTSSNLIFRTQLSTANTANARSFNIICQKQGVDYVGKTAKAVASDQNLSAVGVTKGTMVSFGFGGATELATCTTSPCTLYDAVGNPAGFSVVRSATGTYDITFPSNFWNGTRYHCVPTSVNWTTGEQGGFLRNLARTNTVQRFTFRNSAAAVVDAAASVVCFGERQ